jgi:glycosyl transferase family 25
MKTYIINLERSAVRRKHILQEVERCGLDHEFVTAVDGKTLSASDIEQMCDVDAIKAYPDWLTPGMLGCALSHYNVYRKILQDDVEIAFVLEDDMKLPDNLPLLLEEISKNILKNEVITLYYFSFQPCKLSDQDVTKLTNNYRLHFPMDVAQPITTGGYVITKSAAKTLADIILPVRVAPDSWGYFYDNKGFESFRCVFPVPLKFSGAKSDIHSQSWRGTISRFIDEYRIPILFQIIRAMRNRNVAGRSEIEFVNEPSPVAQIVRGRK